MPGEEFVGYLEPREPTEKYTAMFGNNPLTSKTERFLRLVLGEGEGVLNGILNEMTANLATLADQVGITAIDWAEKMFAELIGALNDQGAASEMVRRFGVPEEGLDGAAEVATGLVRTEAVHQDRAKDIGNKFIDQVTRNVKNWFDQVRVVLIVRLAQIEVRLKELEPQIAILEGDHPEVVRMATGYNDDRKTAVASLRREAAEVLDLLNKLNKAAGQISVGWRWLKEHFSGPTEPMVSSVTTS